MNTAGRIGFIAYVATFAGCAVWLATASDSPIWSLFAAPLVLPLLGMRAGRRRAFVIGGMLLLPYLALGIAEVFVATDARWVPALFVTAGLVFVTTLPAAARPTNPEST